MRSTKHDRTIARSTIARYMNLLAVDTTTKTGSIALLEEEKVLAEKILNVEVTHSEKLLPAIEKVFEEVGLDLSQIQGLGVSIGPGSFTGLRIGLATMKGFAQSLGLPLVGVSSLSALAYSVLSSDQVVVAVLNAGRGEVYAAAYRFEEGTMVRSYDGTIVKTILKEQAIKPDLLTEVLKDYEPYITVSADQLRARSVGMLALQKLKRGEGKDWQSLVPNYLRPADASAKVSLRLSAEALAKAEAPLGAKQSL